jgi:hypothetical protein
MMTLNLILKIGSIIKGNFEMSLLQIIHQSSSIHHREIKMLNFDLSWGRANALSEVDTNNTSLKGPSTGTSILFIA